MDGGILDCEPFILRIDEVGVIVTVLFWLKNIKRKENNLYTLWARL